MVRISDIAKDMNLSEATISNALMDRGRMKPETRQAIKARAGELGYVPANRTRKKPQKHIAVITEDLRIPFVPLIVEGIMRESMEKKVHLPIYHLSVCDYPNTRNPDIATLNKNVKALIDSLGTTLSGILYIAQYPRLIEGLMADITIPAVFALCTRENGIPFVHYDDRQGAYLAVKNLIDSGRERIAMISGPIDSIGMVRRTNGYQQALVDHGLHFDPSLMRIGNWSTASGYAVTASLLDENRKIDSIFAQNDSMALGAMQAITKKGLRIPEDISVIGFDNSALSRTSMPGLTSVAPDLEKIGRTAHQMLLKLLDKKSGPIESVILPCSLIERSSTLRIPDKP